MIRDIAGRNNHTVKLARKLQNKKHRRERDLLVGEGMDLLTAAVEAGAEVADVLVRRELLPNLPSTLRALAEGEKQGGGAGGGVIDIGLCDQETLDQASSLGGSADVIFICRQPERRLADIPLGEQPAFYLEGVGDPGNVGTLCRSALAFGLAGMICSPGTADPYSPKALRAGMGAQFWLPVVTDVSPEDLRAHLAGLESRGGDQLRLLVADPHKGEDARSPAARVSSGPAPIVILGHERDGPQDPWPGAARVTIRQARFDSLNVAMAGTILAYELSRRARMGSLLQTESGAGGK